MISGSNQSKFYAASPNLGELAEDCDAVLSQARKKLMSFNQSRLQEALDSYGNMATRKRVREWIGG